MKTTMPLLFAVTFCFHFPARAQEDAAWRAQLETPSVQKFALNLARRSLNYWFTNKREMPLPTNIPAPLRRRGGVIVTYEKRGQIAPRGCRGTLEPTRSSLASEITRNVIAAATRDARVKPLQPGELLQIRISLSLITQTKPIQNLSQHDATRNGLIAQRGDKIGFVVPFEGRDAATQLLWATRKAGLPDGAPVQLREVWAVRFRE